MDNLKTLVQSIKNWFLSLNKQQQLLTVGLVVVIALFSGKALLRSDLDGNYYGEYDGISMTVVIHGETADLIMTDGEESKEAIIRNINPSSKTLELYSSEKEMNILRIAESDGDNEIVLVKK
ncbi:TPA: hypothetical protein ACGORW_001009 [Streptococcus suis]|nr:hypothetical protein [Streptococcus suis]HEP1820225.1 hypothetical protein [Streptococcus suis]